MAKTGPSLGPSVCGHLRRALFENRALLNLPHALLLGPPRPP
jgi:hypothetical protein